MKIILRLLTLFFLINLLQIFHPSFAKQIPAPNDKNTFLHRGMCEEDSYVKIKNISNQTEEKKTVFCDVQVNYVYPDGRIFSNFMGSSGDYGFAIDPKQMTSPEAQGTFFKVLRVTYNDKIYIPYEKSKCQMFETKAGKNVAHCLAVFGSKDKNYIYTISIYFTQSN